MNKHSRVAAAVLAIAFLTLQTLADDGKQAEVQKTQSTPVESKPLAKNGAGPATAQSLKDTLQRSLKEIQAMSEEAAKAEREDRMPSVNMFAMRLEKDLEADVVRAIGRAQAKTGNIEDARGAWQSALDIAAAISSLDAAEERAKLYIEVARSQNEAGEQNEARFTLRQAIQAARAVKRESMFSIEPPPGMEDRVDPVAKKTDLLRRIAGLQAEIGDKAGSDENFRLAVESAESIKDPLRKVHHLLEIAESRSGEPAAPIWTKALEFALSLKDEFPRARAVESVIRARLKWLPLEGTLTIIADRLKGDFQHYLLWVVADFIASSDKPFAPEAVARLGQLALKAEFDRTSKKIKVFQRIAEAQARLGDYDGAYRTAGEPHPVNDVQNFRATQARVHVMKAIAESQLKAKQLAAAKDTVLMAIELIAPLPDEDAEAYYPLAELCVLEAKTGDLAGALRNVSAVSSSAWKVSILTEIAANHAQAGRAEEAKKTLRLAVEASRGAPNDALWTSASHGGDSMFDPSLPILQTLAHAQARIGDLDAALKTVGEMGQSGFGRFSRGQTIEQIVTTQLEKGDVAGARRAADAIADAESFLGSKADLLEKIAKQQAAKGDAAGVLAWAARERLPKSKLQSLRGMADGIAEGASGAKPKPPATAPAPKPAG
jgi:tetratricopeptide (TPR) repeat protein